MFLGMNRFISTLISLSVVILAISIISCTRHQDNGKQQDNTVVFDQDTSLARFVNENIDFTPFYKDNKEWLERYLGSANRYDWQKLIDLREARYIKSLNCWLYIITSVDPRYHFIIIKDGENGQLSLLPSPDRNFWHGRSIYDPFFRKTDLEGLEDFLNNSSTMFFADSLPMEGIDTIVRWYFANQHLAPFYGIAQNRILEPWQLDSVIVLYNDFTDGILKKLKGTKSNFNTANFIKRREVDLIFVRECLKKKNALVYYDSFKIHVILIQDKCNGAAPDLCEWPYKKSRFEVHYVII